QLPVGNYEITVEAPNFKKYVETGIKLDVNQRRTVDAAVEAGNISETVTVQSDAVAVELSTPTVGNTMSGTQVRELSLNNRNFVQLLALQPGVSSNLDDQVYVGTTNPDGQANVVSLSVNGQRSSSNTYSVDGADTTDRGSNLTIQTYPSVDAIGEFRILRSLYPAESGRSGGGQVNVITRSGTRDFHGTLYEFVRNDKLNANTFLNNARAPLGLDENGKARRPPLRYNNFGYTVGGPVFIPGLYNEDRDKTFFFFSQEFRRTLSFPTLLATVPTVALRQGVFPVEVCVEFTATGTCARRGTQVTNINPTAQAYINEIYSGLPEPNSAFQLFTPARNVFNFRQEIFKIDQNFTDKLTAFYRFQNDTIPTIEPNALFGGGSGIPGVSTTETNSPGRTHAFRATYAANPTLIFEGGYAYSYGAILSQITGKLNRENSPSIQVPLLFEDTTGRIPNITGLGFYASGNANLTSIGGFGPYDNFSTNHSVTLNVTKIIGSHTTKFGALFNRYRKNENALTATNQGSFAFDTAGAPTGATTLQNQLQRYANFLLGRASSFTQARFDLTADLRASNNEFYAQDEWRARPNLTLYYGLRYSRFTPPYDANNQLTNFDPSRFDPAQAFRVNASGNRIAGTGNPFNGIIANDQNVPPGAIPSPFGEAVTNNVKNNFAPRVGLAWDPFGTGKTAIRTGYGVYFDQTLYGIYLQNLGTNPPFQETATLTTTSTSVVRLDNPLAGAVGAPSAAAQTLRGVSLPFRTPYAQHWSLDLQQQLDSKTLVTVGYYGSRGTHLLGIVDLNLLPPGFALTQNCVNASGATVPCQTPGQQFTTAAQELILDQIRPYRGYRAINVVQTRFNSNYHSLQVFAQRRLYFGSQFNLSYTLAKNLTDNQTDRSTAPQNPYDIRADYGRAQLDRRHVFTA
ncbi:MAG: carboxypeptidase-like regulatory domain-containing protein, partial [Acidobacteriota bacterium]|nr:carboxypeptidase-like regulatory domain-containing protein [Acidobacteriota bacterium]